MYISVKALKTLKTMQCLTHHCIIICVLNTSGWQTLKKIHFYILEELKFT